MYSNEVEELIQLYNATSKHSNYQILSTNLKKIIPTEQLVTKSRYEKERLAYILKNVSLEEKSFCDIGANSGFFSFELIENGAKCGRMYEGNTEHAKFVDKAIEILNLSNKLSIKNEYYDFNQSGMTYDIVLLLNVVHHVGDDYGVAEDIEIAKQIMLDSINRMSVVTKTLVLQVGFNWKGNRNKGMFPNGSKKEMIEWLENGIEEYWKINNIGIAEKHDDGILYNDLNESNIHRQDELGEFLNRPIFILKSKKY